MQADYAQGYKKLYDSHWWWRAREKLVLLYLDQFLAQKKKLNILDIGCGDGLFFSKLKKFGNVEGLEADASLVTGGGEYFKNIFIQPLDKDFLPKKKYDLILGLDVIEHIAKDAEALSKIQELLNDNGVVLFTVPTFNALWTEHDTFNKHYRRYTKKTFTQLVQSSGIKVQYSRYIFHFLFFLKIIIVIKEKLLKSKSKPEVTPPLLVNNFFYFLTLFEQKVFRYLPLCFGTSLILIGKKE